MSATVTTPTGTSGQKGGSMANKTKGLAGKYNPKNKVDNLKKKYDPRSKLKDWKKNIKKNIGKAANTAFNKGAETAATALAPGSGKIVGKGLKAIDEISSKLFGDSEKAKLATKVAIVAAPALIPPLILGVFILFLIFIVMAISGALNSPGVIGAPLPLTLTISGPEQAANGDILPYQINATYLGNAQDIIITNKIPDGTDYVSSVPNAAFNPATRTASWNMKTLVTPAQDGTISNINSALTITLRATRDNTTLINMVQGTIIGGVTDAATTNPEIPASEISNTNL